MKNKKNYLDYIPVHAADHPWEVNKQGTVEIQVTNKGFYNWLAQKLFHKPRVSRISLEEFGSFIWQQIDGKSPSMRSACWSGSSSGRRQSRSLSGWLPTSVPWRIPGIFALQIRSNVGR